MARPRFVDDRAPVPARTMAALFVLVVLGGGHDAIRTVQADVQIRQMHVIARHGSRYPLEKEASTLQETTHGSLTPFGQKQMYDLGVWVKETYNNATGFFSTYSPWQVRLESSALDRTMVSADAFALGAYDYTARDPFEESLLPNMPPNIPVYSVPTEHDVELRAHDKCETYHDRLEDLYASTVWRDLEREHAPLLTKLAGLRSFVRDADESGRIPLVNLWNVYDAIHVARTECIPSAEGYTATCTSLEDPADATAVSDAEFVELESLTARVEQLRYGPERATHLLGGPLMLRILDRMERHLSGTFFLYSAHYATILGVFSALGESFPASSSIPDYASALLLLLVEDTTTGRQRVQLVYKADSQAFTAPAIVPLQFCDNEVSCPLPTMRQRFDNFTVYEWCKECNNREAAVCLDYWMEEYKGRNLGLEEPLRDGLLIGISLLVALFTCLCCSSTRIKWEGRRESSPRDSSPQPPSSSSPAAIEMTTTADEPESALGPPKDAVMA